MGIPCLTWLTVTGAEKQTAETADAKHSENDSSFLLTSNKQRKVIYESVTLSFATYFLTNMDIRSQANNRTANVVLTECLQI